MIRFYYYIVSFLLVSIVFVSLSTTRAVALDSRCSPEVWDIMKTQSEAAVTKASALANELLKQNDPVLATTCFDQAMQQTAKAGAIFSDVPQGITPRTLDFSAMFSAFANAFASMVTSGINAGFRGRTLAEDLQNTISGTMDSLLNSYVDAVSASLVSAVQATVVNLFGAVLGSIASGLLTNFFAGPGLGGVNFVCNNMIDVWKNDPTMAVVGGGMLAKTPFVTDDELFDYAQLSMPIAGLVSGSAFDNIINNISPISNSRARLQKAWNDLNVKLVPGGIGSYTNVPAGVDRNSSLVAVLGAM